MSYDVRFERLATKMLKGLDQTLIKRIRARVLALSQVPLDMRLSKPVKMSPDRRTSRVGDWRILYRINEVDKIIYIVAVCPRGKAYETLPPI